MKTTRVVWRKIIKPSTIRYSNLPESYIQRKMEQIEWRNPDHHGPMYPKKVSKRPDHEFVFTEHRPWTHQFHEANRPGEYKQRVNVEPIKNWSFFKGDVVEVLAGPDKGKHGLVVMVVEERNWVFVEGLNCEYKTYQETKTFPGMTMKEEKPLLVTTDVKLVDPLDNQPTEIEWRYTEDGTRVRVGVRTGRILPVPMQDEETVDYKRKEQYQAKPKDTEFEALSKETFIPSLATFEMDLMQKYVIEEKRIPRKSYWYHVQELA